MLKYVSIIAPLILRRGTKNPVRTLSGYMGAIVLTIIAAIFLLAALFTWIASNYGLDLAFLTVGLIFVLGALTLVIIARRSEIKGRKLQEERHAQIKGLLAATDDPLAEHIPDDILMHPISQKVLAQVEDKPLMAGATAVGLGVILSRQLMDTTE